jgi:hypothetical protein
VSLWRSNGLKYDILSVQYCTSSLTYHYDSQKLYYDQSTLLPSRMEDPSMWLVFYPTDGFSQGVLGVRRLSRLRAHDPIFSAGCPRSKKRSAGHSKPWLLGPQIGNESGSPDSEKCKEKKKEYNSYICCVTWKPAWCVNESTFL